MGEFEPAPPLVPRIFRFTDIDQFRSSVRNLDVDFTPLARRISAQQIILNLSGCDVNFTRSFPRIIDAQLAQGCTAVGFSMDDGPPIRFNGCEKDQSAVAIGTSGASYTAVERVEREYASIIFTPEVRNRGWPDVGANWQVFEVSASAQSWLRELVRQILVTSPMFKAREATAVAFAMRESLLAGVDAALATASDTQWASRSHVMGRLKTFRDLQAALASDIAAPLYSTDLANQVGVSVRALHDAVHQYLGISLHRYLRLKRLWLVRQRLLAGAESIKASALAFGFWHLSDFSKSYRFQFGELPSETLARSGKGSTVWAKADE